MACATARSLIRSCLVPCLHIDFIIVKNTGSCRVVGLGMAHTEGVCCGAAVVPRNVV